MRRLFWASFGFGVGIFVTIYNLLPLACLAFLPTLSQREHRWKQLCLVGLGLCLGLWWPGRYVDHIPQLPPTIQLTAQVTDWPYETKSGSGFLAQTTVEDQRVNLQIFTDSEGLTLQPGDSIQSTARCVATPLIRTSTATRGVFWTLYLGSDWTSTRPDVLPWQVWPAHWMEQVKRRVADLFPSHVTGLVQAVLTGDKGLMDSDEYDHISRAGLSHGVAVSGMHLSFLTLFFVQLLGQGHRRTSLVIIPILWVFVCMAGCTHSILRAATMQTILLLAPLVNREGDSPTNLMTALMLLLLQNPFAGFSSSLQLSFSATAGILLFTSPIVQWIKSLLSPLKRIFRAIPLFFGTIGATTLGALSFSMPLTFYHFGRGSVVAVVSNLLALPAIEGTFLGGLSAVIVGEFCRPLGLAIATLITPVAEYLQALSSLCAQLPYSSIQIESRYFIAWMAVVYLMVLVSILGKGWQRPIVLTCCVIITFSTSACLTRLSYTLPQLVVTVLNVGQGQAVLLHSQDRTLLIDCGGNDTSAGTRVADYLADRGINRVDLLVLTHFHDDHANGVPTLYERLPIDVLAIPQGEGGALEEEILTLARENNTQILPVTQNTTLTLGGIDLTLYRPLGGGSANEAGLSILCQNENFSALFTGDMDDIIEGRLIKYGHLPDVDLLMAGHHGASSATSQALLDQVSPEIVTISVGENHYGHPQSDTLRRIDQSGAQIYRTDLQGDITLTLY